MNFQNRDVNIANLGQIDGIIADDHWHSAYIDLFELLRQKTRHTIVEEIIMADWNIGGYMKLEFGENARGATYYIDNFEISGGLRTERSTNLLVDNFETEIKTNQLGGNNTTFSNPGTNYCQAQIVKEESLNLKNSGNGSNNKILRIDYDTESDGAYCGYISALMATNINEMAALNFDLFTSERFPQMLIGLRHATTSEESKVPLTPYISKPNENGWRTASIPLNVFRSQGFSDLSLIDILSFTFENDISSENGTIYLDNIQFRDKLEHGIVADFDLYPMDYNFLGGGFRTVEKGAAAISAGYHEDKSNMNNKPIGTLRISYGGNISLDYGAGRFSYAIWETDLLNFDARQYKDLIVRIRGEEGGEKPNIYLSDGTTRQTVRAKEISPITTAWQDIHIALQWYSSIGVDLSHLEKLQFDFEWEEMSGTIYISQITFE